MIRLRPESEVTHASPWPKEFSCCKMKCSGWAGHVCQEAWGWQMEHSGNDEGCSELCVLWGADDQNTFLLWCVYEARSSQGFLLSPAPALFNYYFLIISVYIHLLPLFCKSCKFLRAQTAFYFCVCEYLIQQSPGPGLIQVAVSSSIYTWK